MRYFVYTFLFTLAYLVMLPVFVVRMRRRGGYRENFGQRFGIYSEEVLRRFGERRRLWVHAVSVGEIKAAGDLLAAMRQERPGVAFVLSTTTSTGYALGKTLVGAEDVLIYFPLDFPWAVRRALHLINPQTLVLMESELWPNIIRECARRGIPAILANGRMSDRSYPRYRMGLVRWFFAPVLQGLRRLFVQYEEDRRRWVECGALTHTVEVMGTVKFDVSPPSEGKVNSVREWVGEGSVMLGASTWPGEEEALLETYKALRVVNPDARLVLVPRHQERGDEAEALIERNGFHCVRRSKGGKGKNLFDVGSSMLDVGRSRNTSVTSNIERPTSNIEQTEPLVYLGDTTGELMAFHAVADVVFVGKSLSPNVGGQNIIEPASLGKAVVVGTHTENFAGVMALFREARAVWEVNTAQEAQAALTALMEDEALRHEHGKRAMAVVAQHRGAVRRTAAAILKEVAMG